MGLIPNKTIVFFEFLPENTQTKVFLSQISVFLVLHETLRFNKFETADFKDDNFF